MRGWGLGDCEHSRLFWVHLCWGPVPRLVWGPAVPKLDIKIRDVESRSVPLNLSLKPEFEVSHKLKLSLGMPIEEHLNGS